MSRLAQAYVCNECMFSALGIGEVPCKTCVDNNKWKPAATYTVNLDERLEPYTNVTYGPESHVSRFDLIDTKLRLVAAIIDRNGVPPTVKEEALSEIARIRELLR